MKCKVTRRSFLGALAFFIGGVGLKRLTLPFARVHQYSLDDPLASKLAKVFANKESATIVGREYLRNVAGEADARLLVDLICSGQADRRVDLLTADLKRLRGLLRIQQSEDFEHGRIVKVRGWILSETEVRLCALATLV